MLYDVLDDGLDADENYDDHNKTEAYYNVYDD